MGRWEAKRSDLSAAFVTGRQGSHLDDGLNLVSIAIDFPKHVLLAAVLVEEVAPWHQPSMPQREYMAYVQSGKPALTQTDTVEKLACTCLNGIL